MWGSHGVIDVLERASADAPRSGLKSNSVSNARNNLAIFYPMQSIFEEERLKISNFDRFYIKKMAKNQEKNSV